MSVKLSPDFWRGRRVWISGHTGFKGSWLALWLLHWGAIVEGYALDPESIGNCSLFESLDISKDLSNDIRDDLLNIDRLRNRIKTFSPDVVFHLAAQPLVQKSYREPLNTWKTNVIGTCNVLDSLRDLDHLCIVLVITTDKVYQNNEWDFAYRESDSLGGHDPYSSSKAAVELAIASWRSSFCGTSSHQTSNLRLASARAGNVIGGGDWAENRIVPDAIRSLINEQPILVRAPFSTRPWQHVLEPLGGYLLLAEQLYLNPKLTTAFNFGPQRSSNRSVRELIEEILQHWPGKWIDQSNLDTKHEASRLDLSTDRAFHQLGWVANWSFEVTVSETVNWYRSFYLGEAARDLCIDQIERYIRG